MKKTANILLNILKTVFMVMLIVILISNIYVIFMRSFKGVKQPAFLGFSHAVVLSGSMADEINVDDFVITKECDDYNTGDIVMFDTGSHFVTHRIVNEENGVYTTKGDANNAADPDPVFKNQITGKVILVIPGIGKFIYKLQTPLGMLVLVVAAFLLIEGPALMSRRQE